MKEVRPTRAQLLAKIALLRKAVGTNRHSKHRYDHVIFRAEDVFVATWDVDQHNGDIDNYKESRAERKFLEVLVTDLEDDYVALRVIEMKAARRVQFLKELYACQE